MPVRTLPTGIDLYYEVHGQGEPLVLIPATGFGGDVWLSDQVPEPPSRTLSAVRTWMVMPVPAARVASQLTVVKLASRVASNTPEVKVPLVA